MAGKNDDDLLVKLALGAGVIFFVVKPLLGYLGLGDNPDVTDINNTDPTENPFSIQYGSAEGPQPAMACDYMQGLKQQYDAAAPTNFGLQLFDSYSYPDFTGNSQLDIAIMAEMIHNAFSLWHNRDDSAIAAAFDHAATKFQVAEVVAYLSCNYNQDLWTLLNRGTSIIPGVSLYNGVPAALLSQIIDRVKQLDDF